MSPIACIPAAILDTALGHLALLFLTATGGDATAAREAANQMLAAYHPRTPDELNLAAEIISFTIHALEALGQSAASDMSLSKILRLRGSAVSLSRESHKAQRKLDQLQKVRPIAAPAQPWTVQPQPVQPLPSGTADPAPAAINQPATPIDTTSQAAKTPAPKTWSLKTWSQSFQQRQAAERITENLKKNRAAHQAALHPASTGTAAPIPANLQQQTGASQTTTPAL